MLNEDQLRNFFSKFSEQYFAGRLPSYSIRVVPHISWEVHENGNCNRKRKLIRIVAGLTDEEALSTLLHEMAHAATH